MGYIVAIVAMVLATTIAIIRDDIGANYAKMLDKIGGEYASQICEDCSKAVDTTTVVSDVSGDSGPTSIDQ
jgi:hypothetical protein